MSSRFATYPSLAGRVVLVTGGGSGIGASLVEHFCAQGARVFFLDIAEDVSHDLVHKLTTLTTLPPTFYPCDITQIDALREAISRIEATAGPIQVLVNNAGNDDRHSFPDVTPEYWDDRIAFNLKHQFFAAQAVAPAMRSAGGGSIINLSSIAWMIPTPNLSVYVTAKAAIIGLTRALAHELGGGQIRVNAVLPGAILTERQRRLWMSPEYRLDVLAKQCLKRDILPDDVAKLVLFLAADDSAAITNQSHIVDGGWI